jgi:glycine hydroxymethyltransferase
LLAEELPVYTLPGTVIPSHSHQFALEAAAFGGGQTMAKQLRQVNILTSAIGLPLPDVSGDMNGLRFGTPEIVRSGMTVEHIPELAGYITDGLLQRREQASIGADVSSLRQQFTDLRYIAG